jgi:hypothetical protein
MVAEKELPPITVSLLKSIDSVVIKSTLLKNGKFDFNIFQPGIYLIRASGTGINTFHSQPVQVTTSQMVIALAPVELKPFSTTLAGITVTAEKQLFEQKADRLIVNVDASVTNTGTTALDVLEKSPGITVDKEGTISLKGRQGAQVFVDGRPIQMEGMDLINYLKNLPSSQMEQLEIMTNPPARYDASGNAGIINIKTKKNRISGMNGSVNLSYSQGRYPKTNEGAIFNYRQNKINLSSSVNHSFRKEFEVLNIQRRIINSTGTTENYFSQQADEISSNHNYNVKVGVDYFADKKTTIGVTAGAVRSNSNNHRINTTNIADASKALTHITIADVETDRNWKNFNSGLYFRRLLHSTGREITSDLDYASYHTGFGQLMINSFYDHNNNKIANPDTLLGSLPQQIRIYSGRLDYLHPLKKNGKFEAGIKSSTVRTDNDARYDSIQMGNRVRDLGRSNHFIYEEIIHAAYVNLSGSLSKKWQGQIGLRLEQTISKGQQKTTGSSFERDYLQLFPTAYLQYKATDQHNFGMNYGRRIRRPNYSSLNPFIRFIDRYTYNKGNPDLRPQLSHQVEMSHSYKNIITTTLNFSTSTDIIQQILEQKGQDAYMTLANLATLTQYGLSINANKALTKWWTSSLFINVFHNRFEGMINNEPILISGARFLLNGTQQFKITKSFSAELSGNFRSAGVQGVLRTEAVWMMNAGISKQVLKNNGTIRLAVRDMFYTRVQKAFARYANVDASFQERDDSRTLTIGFSYRFSKGKTEAQRKRTQGSAGEEQGRAGMD